MGFYVGPSVHLNGSNHLDSHPSYSAATQAIHADDDLNIVSDVAPPLHVATTFRYLDNPEELITAKDTNSSSSDRHIYSRETAPSTTRLETLLTPLLHAPSLTYSSGLAALHAAYTYLNPSHISIGNGYHGSHGVLALHSKLTGAKILPLDCPATDLTPGSIIHLETPLNPTGECYDIRSYADKAHSHGAYLLVDATFGPPGLQDPFQWGADLVMHSGTKYLGGHSDMLCGVLATQREEWMSGLRAERTYLGSAMGSLEGWLGVRSLRTLEVRVQRQSENAGRLVAWLDEQLKAGAGAGAKAKTSVDTNDTETKTEPNVATPQKENPKTQTAISRTISQIHHASLQALHSPSAATWLPSQMPNGYGPVFAITMKTENLARRLPSKLKLFHHATSLGGVESLIEWRTMSDRSVDTRLLRVSVGIEGWEDLKGDLERGLGELVAEEGEEGSEGR